MRAYRNITVVMVCVLVGFTGISYGTETGINILSETHHVWGSIELHPTVISSYDITDSVPVSGLANGEGYDYQRSNTSDFTVDTWSKSDYPYMAVGGAQIDYTFKPLTDILQIAFSGNGGYHSFTNRSVFVLKDLNTSVILDSRSWEWDSSRWYHTGIGWMDDILPYRGSYAVIPGHTYLMTISASSSYSDVDAGHAHLEAVITPRPNTIFVDDSALNDPGTGTQSDPFMRIQDAVDYSVDGDTIIVAEGTYYENIDVNDLDITLTSTDPNDPNTVAATIIDGQHLDSVISIADSNSVIDGFTITNGLADKGGGMYVGNAESTITHCIIKDNTADYGGGVYIDSADTFGTGDNAFNINFVPISGSTNPTSGYGIVNNDYRMGTYEITNDQWNKFKANIAPTQVTGTPSIAYDQNPVYPVYIGTDVPTNNLSWYEGAQFVNWLNTSTGHQAAYKFTGTQGTGDYTLGVWESGDTGYNASNPYRNSNAIYFLPTEDEWVKAAYWNGTSLQLYATPDGTLPIEDIEANYNYEPGDLPWNVGSGSQELNGTFDMMGNIYEWMEGPYNSGNYLSGSYRGLRGGSVGGDAGSLSSSGRGDSNPYYEMNLVGFRVASVPAPITLIENCVISGNNSTEGGGIYGGSGKIENCTIAYNSGGGINYFKGLMTNAIVWGNGANQLINCSEPTYCCIEGDSSGIGNINADPLLADPNNGDFHLKSHAGRWNPNSQIWVYDTVTSPCIDAGDPNDTDWKNELWPNGGQINMGAYGGTPQASKSPNPIGNIADFSHNDCVGMEDLLLFIDKWLVADVLLVEDMDLSGHVDLIDFSILSENWSFCLDQDIVGYWEFSETSGDQAHDSSIYGNHGTLVNGPVWTGDGELSFDGIDDYVEVPDSNSFDFTHALAISVWVNLAADSGNWSWPKVVIKPYTAFVIDPPYEIFTVDLGPHGTFPRFIITDGIAGGQYACVYDETKTLNLDQWYHIVGTYDGATVALYLNGQLIASSPSSISIGQNSMPVSIGGRLGINSFNGLIDEVRIYNRGLTAVEVQNLYQNH